MTGGITIELQDGSQAVKGDYTLFAIFSHPGTFSFPLGISLSVFDVCDNSVFPSAPVLLPDLQDYYTNQCDLVVEATWAKDTISATTTSVCGDYTIEVVFNSAESIIADGSVDS